MNLPSSQRSLEEVVQSAYLADAMDIPLYDALYCGDKWFQSDAAFDLNGIVLIYEHDPGHWHPDERIEGDCDKTNKLLQYEHTIVVRARIAATELPIKHPRLVQVVVPRSKPEHLLYEIARAMDGRLPEPFQSKLRVVDSTKKRDIETYASTVFRDIHPDYELKVQQREALFHEHGLAMDATLFVGIPLSTMKETIKLLHEFGIAKKTIETNPSLLTRKPDTLRNKISWFRVHGFDWTNDLSMLTFSLRRMQETFAFLVGEGISRPLIKKRQISRLTAAHLNRKHTHKLYSDMDETSKLKLFVKGL